MLGLRENRWSVWNRFRSLGRRGSGVQIAPTRPISSVRTGHTGNRLFDAERLGGGASRTLRPVIEVLTGKGAEKMHGADVPVPVLESGNSKTKTGRLWTYVRDDRPAESEAASAVWFAYSPDHMAAYSSLASAIPTATGASQNPTPPDLSSRRCSSDASASDMNDPPPQRNSHSFGTVCHIQL